MASASRYSSKDGRFTRDKDLDEIGRGAFKTVYKGRDTFKNRDIAWCESKLSQPEKEDYMKEITILKQFSNNPHILQLFDSWEITVAKKKTLIIITELMTGGNLKDYGRCDSLLVIRNWGRQILYGLEALHSCNPSPIIHKDLKCENILVDRARGLVKIGDLGLATLKSRTYAKTERGHGTWMFTAPEMFPGYQGREEVRFNELIDMYAFGLCLLEMATGKFPYEELDFASQMIDKVKQGILPDSFSEISDNALRAIIRRCTAHDWKERFKAQELLTNPFFAARQFDVAVIERKECGPFVGLEIHSGNCVCQLSYDLRKDDIDDTIEGLVKSGELAEESRHAATDALIEKLEVLLFLMDKEDYTREDTESGLGDSVSTSVQQQSLTGDNKDHGNVAFDDGKFLNSNGVSGGTVMTDSSRRMKYEPAPRYISGNGVEGFQQEQKDFGKIREVLYAAEPKKGIKESHWNDEYECWKTNLSRVRPLIDSNCLVIATEFHAKNLINEALYSAIATPSAGTTEKQRITMMFEILHRKLLSTDRDFVRVTWQGMLKAIVKADRRYEGKRDKLESLVKMGQKTEAEALKECETDLIRLLQSTVLQFANEAWSTGALSDEEKDKVTSPDFHNQSKLTEDLLKEITQQIKDSPVIFYEVTKIFKKVGGPLMKATERYLTLNSKS